MCVCVCVCVARNDDLFPSCVAGGQWVWIGQYLGNPSIASSNLVRTHCKQMRRTSNRGSARISQVLISFPKLSALMLTGITPCKHFPAVYYLYGRCRVTLAISGFRKLMIFPNSLAWKTDLTLSCNTTHHATTQRHWN